MNKSTAIDGTAKLVRKANYGDADALTRLMLEAENGCAEAQFGLGTVYKYGEGAPKDITKTLHWYRKSADQGYAEAQFSLGLLYAHGIGVPKDYEQAINWWFKAADQKHVLAQFNLGVAYATGNGVAKDCARAAIWYCLAAEQGDAKAQFNLGLIYAKGQSVKRDPIIAYAFWALNLSYPFAKPNISVVETQMTPAEIAAAKALAIEMAKPGNFTAAYDAYIANLKKTTHSETDVCDSVNKEKYSNLDLEKLTKFAEAGHANAQWRLGDLYVNANSVPFSYENAALWLHKAADQGFVFAIADLGYLYIHGNGVPRNLVVALALLNVSTLLGRYKRSSERDFLYRMSHAEIAAAQVLAGEMSKPGNFAKALDAYIAKGD